MISAKNIFVVFWLVSCGAFSARALAADEKTLDLAKKEGRVSFYTSMGADA